MTEQPREPGTFNAGTLLVYQRPNEPLATLTEMEFKILRDGEVNDYKAGRNLWLGLLGSAVIGLIGLIATIDWDTAIHQARKTPFVFIILLSAIALTSGCMTLFYHMRCNRADKSAYSELMKKLEDLFQKHRLIDAKNGTERNEATDGKS